MAGHDVVAYFTEGKPVLGKYEFTTVYNDAIYQFSSQKKRDLFKQNPEKYAPMYSGFCAYGATFGKKFDVNGKAFEIVNGKLDANKNLHVYDAWREDIPKHIEEANDFGPKIVDVAADEL